MKKIHSILGVIALTFAIGLPAKADTYVLADSQGAMTYEFLTGWTFGTLYPDMISALNTGSASNHSMPSYLKFDLSGLIAASVGAEDVSSATLRLYLVDVAASGFGANPSEDFPVSVEFSLVTGGDWNKNTITYGNAPAVGSVIGSVTGIDSIGEWVELDLTDVLQGWLSGDVANYGLKITQPANVRDGSNTSIFALFASDGAASNQPQLVVNTVPEPGTGVLFAIAAGALGFFRRRRAAVS